MYATLNHGYGVEYHEADINEFLKSPFGLRYKTEAGDLFNGYFSDPNIRVDHNFNGSLHMIMTTKNVTSHLLFLAAQRIETVVEGYGIHALCHGLKYAGFDILDSVALKLGDKL